VADPHEGVVVVTGAAQGVGRSIAEAFADAGAPVAVADVDGDAARAVADEISRRSEHPALGVAVDVGDEAAVVALAETVTAELGAPRVWVNNAGVTRPAMLHKMTVEEFDLVLRVHVRGTFLGTREAARSMRASQTPGVILNVTSSAGLQGTIGQINYSAAKGAITSMTKSAAKELARSGIRVNAVAPVAATPMTEKLRTDEKLSERFLASIPLGRFAEPDEIAGAFLWLASPAAAYMTGQVICIDGGLYMAS
jgi:3-oxoacyl-[acyl-carrier protein] reductase